MTVVICEICKGTGKVEKMVTTYYINVKRKNINVATLEPRDTPETTINCLPCYSCGGSGCKWKED